MRGVAFQQRGADHPLDDVVIKAVNPDGSPATLEIQVKRTLTFTASDTEFRDVVGQIWQAAQKPDFATSRYELAAAIARTTTRIEQACQEVLHWARQLPDGATFAAHINRPSFASNDMRSFVDVFRTDLGLAGAPTDDETAWRLLRRFQILVFDFESAGSDYEHRARENFRWILSPDQADRANDLWPVLIDHVGACARSAGATNRAAIVTLLQQQHGVRLTPHAYLRPVYERLAEAAEQALDEIDESVGGVRLARNTLIDEAYDVLHQHPVMLIQGRPGVGKSAVMKHLAVRLQTEGCVLALRRGRIISGGWLAMAHTIGWAGSQAELFNELGAGSGAILFIDNIDQIDDQGEWATVTDLLSQATRSQGWRIVATCGVESDDWKTKLPARVRTAGIGGSHPRLVTRVASCLQASTP
ncbi:MAG TPA: AAA family ATPase [Bradyrhizobium sp.]|nr:AAA family ATPase [Bradyrhizobium sp.]